MQTGLENRVVVITGASRGIGRATALAFAREKARVVLSSRSEKALDAVADEVREIGAEAVVIPCDVTDREAVVRLIEGAVKAFERLDVLVNNAGSSYTASLVMSDADDWEATFAVNVIGTYYPTRAALRPMIRAKWGRIVNIASVAGQIGAAYASAYASAKAAVLGFTKSVARETARIGITANAICPWHVDTELMNETMGKRARMFGKSTAEYLETIIRENPQQRLIEAEEIAALAVFLASDLAAGITGQAISVCGGAVLQ